MRTGAASGVATKHLAREDASTLGIYGAGWQAESQLEAIAAVRNLERVIVYSRSEESRKGFAEKMGGRLGMEIETTHASEEPAAQDIVVTVMEERGDQVRIGVSAPRDVDVHREEVFLELQETNRSAASPSAEAVEALGSLLPPTTGSSEQPPPGRPEDAY